MSQVYTIAAISEDRILDLLLEESRKRPVFAPVEEDGLVLLSSFAVDRASSWARPATYINTDNTPKDAFMPQTEPYLRFHQDARRLDVSEVHSWAGKETFVFGIRPCDVKAIELLDRVLTEGEYEDEMYIRRRQSTLVASVACSNPGPYCFCDAMGVSHLGSKRLRAKEGAGGESDGCTAENQRPGCDLMFYPILHQSEGETGKAQTFIVEATSDHGQEFLNENKEYFEFPSRESLASAISRLKEGFQKEASSSRFMNLDVEGLTEYLSRQFESPYWSFASRRCRSCGACTYVCPTCYCFAVTDSLRIDRGIRSRCWDSCQFQEFLLMAAGHNPRPTKKERVRQRFLHKLQYYPEKYGDYMCVGCGRCVEKCPVGLHIAQVVYDMNKAREGVNAV